MVDPARPLRSAASLILVRGEPLEVLMVRRHAKASFASSYVFPGGVVEPDDYDDAWLPRLIGADTLSRAERAARIAACRETFEETQILVAVDSRSVFTAGPHTRHGMSFFDGLSASGLHLDLSKLVPFAHWITPEGMPRRFDTRFYITTAPPEQDGASDGVEITDLNWTQPAIGVEEALSGARQLYFPTLANLELLSEAATVEGALHAAVDRPPMTVTPVIQTEAGETWFILPEGLGYKRTRAPFQAQ